MAHDQSGEMPSESNLFLSIFICTFLVMILRLMVCVCQMKLIGGLLRKYTWVLKNVGIHTKFMQSIRQLIDRPDMTREKVAILCGGPDWPVMVLTGIFELPVIPVLKGVTPC